VYKRQIEWKKIQSINVTNYKGPVYSLNVERHHKYISDEIITCNSIYAFRGANMWNIINFDKDYPSAKVVKLEQNYRSTKNIIEASNALIENNIDRKAKIAWTANKPGLPVVICESYMPENEAEFVAKTALNLAQGNMSYEDMAVLYRSNYQSRQIESALMKYNIPYQVVSGFGFFERKEIKDFISILKTAVNPNNLTSLSRVIGLSANGLGIGTLNKLSEYGATIGLGTYDVMENPTEVKGIGKKKGQAILNFKNNYLDEIERVMEDENLNLVEKTAKIYEISNYESHLKKEPETFENRKENINELFNLIHNYYNKNTERDLQTFLLDLTLLSDQDKVDEDNNKIKLMTVHASKGLEFSAVFVVGMEDGTFPHAMCLETDKEIEEERRLCYVAMTRAESRLFLSYCNVREKFFKPMKMNPSRFLDEIPLQYQKNIRIA
jgi:DNA helicase-2/ATP-dependent DNA helicase PcrA